MKPKKFKHQDITLTYEIFGNDAQILTVCSFSSKDAIYKAPNNCNINLDTLHKIPEIFSIYRYLPQFGRSANMSNKTCLHFSLTSSAFPYKDVSTDHHIDVYFEFDFCQRLGESQKEKTFQTSQASPCCSSLATLPAVEFKNEREE